MWAWSSNMNVHGSPVCDAQVTNGGRVIGDQSALVDKLNWTVLSQFILKVSPGRREREKERERGTEGTKKERKET